MLSYHEIVIFLDLGSIYNCYFDTKLMNDFIIAANEIYYGNISSRQRNNLTGVAVGYKSSEDCSLL